MKVMATALFWFKSKESNLFARYNGSETVVTTSEFLEGDNRPFKISEKISRKDVEKYFQHFDWKYQCFEEPAPSEMRFYSCPKDVGGYKFRFPVSGGILEIKCFHFPFLLKKLPLIKEGFKIEWIKEDVYMTSSSFMFYYEPLSKFLDIISSKAK